MGDRGPTATDGIAELRDADYSRWEIGGQPQQLLIAIALASIIADGRSGANRNKTTTTNSKSLIIADGRSGANRNVRHNYDFRFLIIADGRSGANRNWNQQGQRNAAL